MRPRGKIKSWNKAKGFGFVAPMPSGKPVFVHKNAFSNRHRQPRNGDIITYSLSTDRQGRTCATKAAFSGEKRRRLAAGYRISGSIIVALAFLTSVTIAVCLGLLPLMTIVIYGAVSCLTFLFYYLDKSAAKRGARRTPETTLHGLALAGGWPGALIAQQLLRHKSKKRRFRLALWVTVLVNSCLVLWLSYNAH